MASADVDTDSNACEPVTVCAGVDTDGITREPMTVCAGVDIDGSVCEPVTVCAVCDVLTRVLAHLLRRLQGEAPAERCRQGTEAHESSQHACVPMTTHLQRHRWENGL